MTDVQVDKATGIQNDSLPFVPSSSLFWSELFKQTGLFCVGAVTCLPWTDWTGSRTLCYEPSRVPTEVKHWDEIVLLY